MSKILGVIPARYDSSRFPGKPLVNINGKSMILRVYEACMASKELDKVIVATDDKRILDHILENGGNAVMTLSEHQNGTERIAEVAKDLSDFDYIINIQGDEPCINPKQIDDLIDFIKSRPKYGIYTQAQKFREAKILGNKNSVKVLFNNEAKAIWFKREVEEELVQNLEYSFLGKHVGIYGFKRNVLLDLVQLKPSQSELENNLEQLRWLDNDYEIGVVWTAYDSPSVDVPEDLEEVLEFLKRGD